ncbi:hypothetical protein ARALYDRAFT_917529 [Arabidopsis lyrata subsp. lyrata]|uniref:peptidylprolyl isomerase n=1 Tax=Arabidopsis lyrata subsp. lyrata TaxID=81972 RepID=D7MST5_ARALL|nr:hypothetical protein ARALYDRAFT_917529 [Arabidopsis lyrata subsp. lyrata]
MKMLVMMLMMRILTIPGYQFASVDFSLIPTDGFGEKGKPASVPPSATLVINLELVSWKTVSEVTDDNKVMKKILKEGKGYERPNKGSVVKVKLIGTLQNGTVFLKIGHGESEGPFKFKTDEEPEYAFASTVSRQELAVVPPNSTVNYEVDLVTFEKERELWDMNTEEKIEAAGKKKEEGNAKFKAGKYALASKRYDKAVKFIEYDTSFSEEEKKQAKALKVACNLQDVACKLKLKDYKQAEKLCTKVLELESTNVKALFVLVKAIPAMSELQSLMLEAWFAVLEGFACAFLFPFVVGGSTCSCSFSPARFVVVFISNLQNDRNTFRKTLVLLTRSDKSVNQIISEGIMS